VAGGNSRTRMTTLRRRERSPVIREPRCRRLPDSPEVDANAMYDQINLVGSTTQLPEDTEVSETETGAAVVKADQVGSTPVVEESSSAANSEYSVDLDGIDKASAAKLKADAKKASQDVAVSQLIAAVALQALVLPNPGGEYSYSCAWGEPARHFCLPLHSHHFHSRYSCYSLSLKDGFSMHELIQTIDLTAQNDDRSLLGAQNDIRPYFDKDGGLIKLNDPQQQAQQFAAIVMSVLLTKKANLKSSLQGYSVDAFLCAAAELVIQLDAFADTLDEASEPKNLGTKRTWKLMVWIMGEAVNVEPGDLIPFNGSEAGIFALEKLDAYAKGMLIQVTHCSRDTTTKNPLYSRYLDTKKWLNEDVKQLRLTALLAESAGLEGYLKGTIGEMKLQLTKTAK
jgi:hypothetical protein